MGYKNWNKPILVVIILIVIAIAGCNADQTNNEPTTQPDPTNTVPPTAIPNPTATPTITPLPTDIPEQGELLFTMTFPQLPQIIRSDDESLLYTHDGFTFQVLDGEDYSTLYQSELNSSGEGNIVQVSPDGSMVVLHNQTYAELLYWQESDLSIRLGYSEDISSTAFSNNQNYVVYKSKSDCIQTLNLENRKNSACYPLSKNSKHGFFTEPAISPDGSMIAAGYTAGSQSFVYVWDTANQDILFTNEITYFEINCLAFHPNGEHLIVADDSGDLSIFDVTNAEMIKQHTGFDRDIQQIEYSEDGKIISMYLPLDRIKQFNLMNAEIIIKPAYPNDPYTEKLLLENYLYPGQKPSLAFNPQDNELAVAQGNVQVVSLEDQSITKHFYEDNVIPNANIAYSPNGEYIAAINYFGNIHIWDIDMPAWEQKIVNTNRSNFSGYADYQKNIYSWAEGLYEQLPLEFSPDSKELAFLNSWTINVWNMEDWTIKDKREDYTSRPLTDLSYSADGNTLYGIKYENQDVRISDGSDGDFINWANLESSSKVENLSAAIKNGLFGRVLFGSGHKNIEIVDIETDDAIKIPIPSQVQKISSIEFSPTGHLIYLIDADGKVYIWQTSNGELLFASNIPMTSSATAISIDGQLFANLSVEDHNSVLSVWRLAEYIDTSIFNQEVTFSAGEEDVDENIINQENVQNIEQLFATGIGDINKVMWGKDGEQIHVFTSQGYFRLDPSTLEVNYADENSEIQFEHGFVFPDQSVFASTHLPDNMMQIWDLNNKRQLVEFVGQDPVIMGPDHQSILFLNGEYGLTQWDVNTAKVRQNYNCESAKLSEPTFSADGNYLAAIESSQTICIWNTADASLIDTIPNKEETILYLQFSPNGNQLFSATDQTIHMIDITNDNAKKELKIDLPSTDSQITGIQVSPDDSVLAFSIADTLWIYDLSTDEVISKLSDQSTIESFSFNGDGSAIVTQNNEGTLTVWSVATQEITFSKRVSLPEAKQLIPLMDGTIAIRYPQEYIVFEVPTGIIVSSGKIERGQIIDIDTTGSFYITSYKGNDEVVDMKTNNGAYAIKDVINEFLEESSPLLEYANLTTFFSHDGKKIVAYNDDMLWVIDHESRSVVNILDLPDIKQAGLSNDDTVIILVQNDDLRLSYDLSKNDLIEVYPCTHCSNESYVFHPNDKWLILLNKGARAIETLSVDKEQSDTSYYSDYIFLEGYIPINTAAFSPNGELLVFGKEDGQLEFVNADSFESIYITSDQVSEINLAAFTQDGQYIVTINDNGVIHILGIKE